MALIRKDGVSRAFRGGIVLPFSLYCLIVYILLLFADLFDKGLSAHFTVLLSLLFMLSFIALFPWSNRGLDCA